MTDKTDALQTLHTRLIDSREGFREAMDDADGDIGGFLRRCAEERGQFHDKVHTQMAAEGIDVSEKGSTAAVAHRALIQLRGMISSGPEAVYAEAARGEEYLLSAYDDAVEATKGDPSWDFLIEQRAAVSAAVQEGKSLSA